MSDFDVSQEVEKGFSGSDVYDLFSKTVEGEEQTKVRASKIKEQVEKMTLEQLERFEFYVRAHFERRKIKNMLAQNFGSKGKAADETAIIVGGLAKLYLGELMQVALEVKREETLSLPIDAPVLPRGVRKRHLMEAALRLRRESQCEGHTDESGVFGGDALAAGVTVTDL
jgi:hypothetical protein